MRQLNLLLCLALCWGLSTTLGAQVSEGGTPISFSKSTLSHKIAQVQLPKLDNAQLKKQYPVTDRPIYEFGEPRNLDIDLKDSANLEVLDNGAEVWRLQITSKGALGTSLMFSEFWLPEGAKLYLYNSDRTAVLGAFTAENNKEYRTFATMPMQGESVILEYSEPADTKKEGVLKIGTLMHIFRAILNIKDTEKAYGDAASCNDDAWCKPDWCREFRSVAMILMPGGACSGALVMNKKGDFRPYLMTAYHCIDANDNGNISQAEIDAVQNYTFIFNYQRPFGSCNANVAEPSAAQSVSGGVLHAYTQNDSDFALIELSSRPPIDYWVTYAGLDVTDDKIGGGAGAHHARTDVKKISTYNQKPLRINKKMETIGWTKTWDVNWDTGTTQPGSSGSPLFSSQRRLIGVLSGGTGNACSSIKRSYYSRLGVIWSNSSWNGPNWIRRTLDPDGEGLSKIDYGDPCQEDINLHNAELSEVFHEGRYDAADDIRITGNSTLKSNASATLNAGDKIIIGSGFRAEAGSRLRIEANGCTRGCYLFGEQQVDETEEELSEVELREEETPLPPNELKIYPNPVQEQATIEFAVGSKSSVQLTVFDLFGKQVTQPIVAQMYEAGTHQTIIHTQNLPVGQYLCEFRTNETTTVVKFIKTEF